MTASLAALLDPPPEPPRVSPVEEAVPETIAEAVPRDFESEIALVEAEMLEASGPIRIGAPPLPRVSAPPATTTMIPVRRKTLPQGIRAATSGAAGGSVLGWRTGSAAPLVDRRRSSLQRAVELFDCGLELRAAGQLDEALDAWEKAWALAPDNRVYESNVERLRTQLTALRSGPHRG